MEYLGFYFLTKKYFSYGKAQPFLPLCLLAVDCKTVRIFAYSSKREQSNERSGKRLKTESETGEKC